jgi:hypothetical protein
MNVARIDDALSDLDPEELPDTLRLLVAMEKAGLAETREALLWRGRIAAWRIFHEDPQLWIDGPEA